MWRFTVLELCDTLEDGLTFFKALIAYLYLAKHTRYRLEISGLTIKCLITPMDFLLGASLPTLTFLIAPVVELWIYFWEDHIYILYVYEM